MDHWHELLPIPWLLAGFIAYGVLVGWAWSGIDRWRLRRDSQKQHLLFASSIAVMVLWLAGGSVLPGPSAHLLGMTAFTLLVGWRQAMIGSLFPVVGVILAGIEPWPTLGLTGLLLAAVPIGVTHAVWRLTERWLPHSLLGYFAVCTVLGSVIAAGLGRLAVLGLLAATGIYSVAVIGQHHLSLLPLALLQECLVNITAVAAVVVVRPKWLTTLPQRRYFSR
jgi:uncharacterized membrane protein